MKSILSCVVVSFLLLQGCQYSPDENNFQDIDIPDPSAIDLSQFSSEDTLFIPITTIFSISVLNYENRHVYEAHAFVDGNSLEQNRGFPNLTFRIYPESYSVGVHTLEIVFTLSSGSGSLADQVEVERLKVSKKWTFEVDTSSPTKTEILDAAFSDGALKIDWARYGKKNFLHYRLGHSFYQYDIKDINTTSFVDTTYVGGERIYNLTVYNHQNRFSAMSSKKYVDDGLTIVERKIADQKFHIKWNRSRYDKAFKSYVVRNANGVVIMQKMSISDTSVSLSPAGIELGYVEEAKITTVGKGYDPSSPGQLYYYPTETIKLYQGERVLDHDLIKYIQATNSAYTRFDGRVLRLNADNLDTLAVTSQPIDHIDVSKSGEYAYSVYSTFLSKRDPQTLVTEKIVGINTLLGQTNVQVYDLSVSNNNKVAIQARNKYWIVDMNTNSIIHQGTTVSNTLNLSADFNFFYDGASLYGHNGTEYSKLMDLPNNSAEVEFNANFPDEAIILRTSLRKVTILKPWTNEIVREFQLKDYSSWMVVDEKTNLALFITGNYNNIYDLSTGNLKLNLGYAGSGDFYYTLFNNHLYRGSFFVSLDEYRP